MCSRVSKQMLKRLGLSRRCARSREPVGSAHTHRFSTTASCSNAAEKRKTSGPQREQPTHGFYIMYPEIPDESIAENKLLQSVVNGESLPPFQSLAVDEALRGVSQIALNYGGVIAEASEAFEETLEASFDKIFTRVFEEMAPLLFAWHTTHQLVVTNDWGKPEKDMLLHELHRMSIAVNRNHTLAYAEPSLYKAALELSESPDLDVWQKRLVNKVLVEGRMNGMRLTAEERDEMERHIDRIVDQTMTFTNNLICVHYGFEHSLSENLVAECPLHALHVLVEENSVRPSTLVDGPWVVRLTPQTIYPFMRYCPDRVRRHNAWSAWTTRAAFRQPLYNNSRVIESTRHNRTRVAQLLGYDNVTEMAMSTKMAENSATVRSFIDTIRSRLKPAYLQQREASELYAEKHDDLDSTLKPSDMFYYGRKLPQHNHEIDLLAATRFFPFQHVLQELMALSEDWFGLSFVQLNSSTIERWHPSVTVFNVIDVKSGSKRGTLYIDPYARLGRKSGWECAVGRVRDDSVNYKPIMYLNCWAFMDEQQGDAMLHWEELGALAREFGRALLFFCSESPYGELSGSNFVEQDAADTIPMFFERLVFEPNLLQRLSAETAEGDTFSEQSADKMSKAVTESMLFETYRALFWSEFDHRLFTYSERSDMFWLDLYQSLHQEYFAQPSDKDDHSPCSFTPLFTGRLAGSYYSAIWSEMMACDLLSAYDTNNPDQSRTLSMRLRDSIMAWGGGRSAKESFRDFRDRDPSVLPICKLYAPNTALEPEQQQQQQRDTRVHTPAKGARIDSGPVVTQTDSMTTPTS